MKKMYETPEVEVVKFQYRDQVVVASGGYQCVINWDHAAKDGCASEVVKAREGV